jgi:hypothetical protein
MVLDPWQGNSEALLAQYKICSLGHGFGKDSKLIRMTQSDISTPFLKWFREPSHKSDPRQFDVLAWRGKVMDREHAQFFPKSQALKSLAAVM